MVSGQEDTPIYGVSDANLRCYYNLLQDGQISNGKGIGTTEPRVGALDDPNHSNWPGRGAPGGGGVSALDENHSNYPGRGGPGPGSGW